MGFFLYFRFKKKKAFSFKGLCPLTPTKGVALFVSLEESLKAQKRVFVSGCLKLDEVPGNGLFHTLDLEKAFNFRGALPPDPSDGCCQGESLKVQ